MPISPADMENIENNNAIDYIPNRNDIAAAVSVEVPDNLSEPVSPSRSVYSMNRNFSENSASAAAISPARPYQSVLDIETDVLQCRTAGVSSMSPGQSSTYSRSDSETNPFIGYAAVELVDIHIDMDSGESIEEPLLGLPQQRQKIPFTLTAIPTVMRYNEQSTQNAPGNSVLSTSNRDVEISSCNEMKYNQTQEGVIPQVDATTAPSSTDFSSVEEALRALDFAIYGEESLLQRDDSADDDDDIDEDEDQVLVPPDCTVNSNTIIVQTEQDNEHANGLKNDESLQYVREIAENLVAGIMVECQQFINNAADCQMESINSQENNESEEHSNENTLISQDLSLNASVVDAGKMDESQEGLPNHSEIHYQPCLDISAESNESFDFEQNSCFVASTPFHKRKTNDDTHKPRPKISPEIYTIPPANATYDADSILENDAQSFVLDINNVPSPELQSSDVSTMKLSQIIISPPMPTIKIISDCDTTSEDLTTATPVNTPIELNYNMDTWDKFVLKNMSQPIQSTVLKTSFDVQEPCTSAQALAREAAVVPQANVTFDASKDLTNNSGWFLHPQLDVAAPDGTFNVEDNMDNDSLNTEHEDNEENLNLTFDELRKKLAEALPHAQGSMAGPQEFSDDDDDEMEDGAIGGVAGDGTYEQP